MQDKCNHIWSTNSGKGGRAFFGSTYNPFMVVHCAGCDIKKTFTPIQWASMSENFKTEKPKPRCNVCSASVHHGVAPEANGEYWCSSCDEYWCSSC